jgi:hypothetical protein
MVRTFPGRTLVAIRLSLGASAWLAPRLTLCAFGLDAQEYPEAAYAMRLFGARNATLGVGLLASAGDDRRLWWRLGIVCDLADVTVALISRRAGYIPRDPVMTVRLVGAGLIASGLGIAALVEDDV